jgi:L-serine dehydratase
MGTYARHSTDTGLMAGCLGCREDDPESRDALKKARALGIGIQCRAAQGEDLPRNLMRIRARRKGMDYFFDAVSTGGGNFIIRAVNHLELQTDGNHYLIYRVYGGPEDLSFALRALLRAGVPGEDICAAGRELLVRMQNEPPAALLAALDAGARHSAIAAPLYPFRKVNPAPVYRSFREFLGLAEKMRADEICIRYESSRSGRDPREVLDYALRMVHSIRRSFEDGFSGGNELIDGFASGRDGRLLYERAQAGGGLLGKTYTLALARAVVLAERNAGRGLVVAAPTGGAAGIPGAVYTVGEALGKDESEIARAFLVMAGVGVVIGNKASFSGAVGGCQGEIGAGAAMGAAGAAYLYGGGTEEIVHAAALVLKNVLGMSCDPPAGTVEVPCIKRNAMAASLIFMGAEMALAGIRSVIPPDEIVDALADTQRRLPNELKGGCGGLASTRTAETLRQRLE